jgi:hypothetical protein
MKRVFAGFGWFLATYFGILMLCGAILGAVYQARTGDASFGGGYRVGNEFGQRFGGIIFLFSVAFSVAGTWMGVLPGTRRKKPETAHPEQETRKAA